MMRHNYNTRPVLDSLQQRKNKLQAPLEQKIKLYLDLERDIRLLEVELLSLQSIKSDFDPAEDVMEQEMYGSSDKILNDKEQMHAEMLDRYKKLKQEVIQMLPGKNKFVEISMGYGPGMIGYFTIDPETHEPLPEPVLRVLP